MIRRRPAAALDVAAASGSRALLLALAVATASGCAAPRRAAPPGTPAASPPVVGAAERSSAPRNETGPASGAATPDGGRGAASSGPRAPFVTVGGRAFDGADVAREFFRSFRREAFASMNRMVVDEIVAQEAERSGMTVPETWLAKERDKAFEALKREAIVAYGKGAEPTTYLENEFKETPAKWARRTEDDLKARWLRDRVVRLHGLRQERAEIQLIAVRDEAMAKEIAAKLDQGADFAALATAHSIHESAPAGGRLPPVPRESLNPAIADRAFELPIGVRSGILAVDDRGGGGQFDILRVLKRHPARTEPWGALAAEIEEGLSETPVSRFEFVAWQLAAFRLYNVVADDSL